MCLFKPFLWTYFLWQTEHECPPLPLSVCLVCTCLPKSSLFAYPSSVAFLCVQVGTLQRCRLFFRGSLEVSPTVLRFFPPTAAPVGVDVKPKPLPEPSFCPAAAAASFAGAAASSTDTASSSEGPHIFSVTPWGASCPAGSCTCTLGSAPGGIFAITVVTSCVSPRTGGRVAPTAMTCTHICTVTTLLPVLVPV